MPTVTRTQLLKQAPPNSWIALSEDETRMVGSGQTFEEAVKMAESAGVSDPVLIRIPDDWVPRLERIHRA